MKSDISPTIYVSVFIIIFLGVFTYLSITDIRNDKKVETQVPKQNVKVADTKSNPTPKTETINLLSNDTVVHQVSELEGVTEVVPSDVPIQKVSDKEESKIEIHEQESETDD